MKRILEPRNYATKPRSQVLVIFEREARLLLGLKQRGLCKGYWVPAGGHINKNETAERAAIRESRSEFGLKVLELDDIGMVEVRIDMTGERRTITVFRARKWTGIPSADYKEFSMVRFFSRDQIPWDMMLPGDQEWLGLMLTSAFRALIDLHCGKDRLDVRHIWMHLISPDVR